MTTAQQHADALLAQWQSLRKLPPEDRIELLFVRFFAPLSLEDIEFDAVMREVHEVIANG